MQDKQRLAILYDHTARYSPSNGGAIERFMDIAHAFDMEPTIVHAGDIDKIQEYNALLIRDTTHVENYTYTFAVAAEYYKVNVLDTPFAIQIACNKIWQTGMFSQQNITYPETVIVTLSNWERLSKTMTYPRIIKLPDANGARGIYLIKNDNDFRKLIGDLFNNGAFSYRQLLCQEVINTEFDWRIGVLNKTFLYACKHYHPINDWRILKYDIKGMPLENKVETIAVSDLPWEVLDMATQCLSLLDHGLYSIDIKQTDDQCYCMEITDNPTIDHGVEDAIIGEKLYSDIISSLKSGNQ